MPPQTRPRLPARPHGRTVCCGKALKTPFTRYAHINRHVCQRLIERGHDLALCGSPFAEAAGTALSLPDSLRQRWNHQLAEPDVVVRHHWPPDFHPPKEGHWVMMQPWELSSLPAAWIPRLTHEIDDLWVPSRFVRECCLSSGVPADRVHVVPLGVADEALSDELAAFPLTTSKRFRFLYVGGTLPRKGIDLLLRNYCQVFSNRDDVCLVIKDMGVHSFYNSLTAEKSIARAMEQPGAPAIEYLSHELTDTEVLGLYSACDCLVHPFRAEGFGLPIVEAMACGLPVIATAYGPTLEYCSSETAYLVPASVVPLAEELPEEVRTVSWPRWAQPDEDALRSFLRHVVEHPDEARAKAAKAQAHIRRHYTWDDTVRCIEERLETILRQPIRRFRSAH